VKLSNNMVVSTWFHGQQLQNHSHFHLHCVFINKLIKIRSDIPYSLTNSISSAISPIILLLYQIHLIFHILVLPRQELELLAYGLQLENNVSILCHWFVVFRHSLNLWNLVSSTIPTPLMFHTKIKAFHSNMFTMHFTSQLASFWFFRNWNQQIKVSSLHITI